jgi:putative hemolysin
MTLVVLLQFLFILLLLVLSSLFSSSEAAYFTLKPWQVQAREGADLRQKLVARLLSDPPRLLITLLLGNECVNVTLSFVSSDLRHRLLPGSYGAAIGVALTTLVLILFGDALPKAFAAHHPLKVARAYSPMLTILLRVLRRPARFILGGLALLPGRRSAQIDVLEELKHLLGAARTEGSFRREEEHILARILTLQRDPASSLMIPRTAMVFLSEDSSIDSAVKLAALSPQEWIVVHGETADDVLGVVSQSDLLSWSLSESPRELAKEARPAPFHPESRPLREVFLDLFERDNPAVLLTDEYGGLAGILSREHLAATILLPEEDRLGGGGRETLPGTMPFHELRERYPKIPEDARCKTLAGHVLNLAGRVPAQGEAFDDGPMRYVVREATPRQILAVEVLPRSPDSGAH